MLLMRCGPLFNTNDNNIAVNENTFIARTPRQRRYNDRNQKRLDARRVAQFQKECVTQASVFSALSLPSPFVDPVELIEHIVGACNGDLGNVLYVSATSTRHQLLFESYFPSESQFVSASAGEDKLRASITTQQKREDDAQNEVTDNARYLLTSFNAWIRVLRRVKRQKKTVAQCAAFVNRFTHWAQSLYLLTRGSRRLRFLAVSRRKRLLHNHHVQSNDAEYDTMFS